ncbi:MAG TPA: glycosyltransferase, partial [Candidatus Mediterraneibacter excrementipullorum]|nr:glycosyltransferase [Candidatus Mediterraneibacter excrementipullorum]
MKILVVCQYYYPEPFRITDICEEMVRRGHEVQVVTGYPNYPEGVLYDGYGKGKKIDEIINGVKVHRCYTIPRKTGALYRFLNYYSYCFSSSRYIKNCMSSNGMPFDIVFVNQLSPVMMGKAAVKYKKKFRVPTIMYCLDIWPESLIAGGIKRTSLLYKFFHRVSRKIYRQMDKILITSQLFSEYLEQEFEIESQTIEYLPQYAEGIFDILPEKKKSDR